MQKKTYEDLFAEVQELRAQLDEAQETLNAIRRGEVDGLVVSTPMGDQVYTITGAEKPYRALIEDMREGAVMLSDNNTILYCNNGFSRIVKQPLEKLIGTNIQEVVSPTHSLVFEELLNFGRRGEGLKAGEIGFLAADKTVVPTHMSVNSFQKDDAKTTFLVIIDLTQHMQEDVKRYTASLEREIHRREEAEEELRESERKFKTLTDNAPDAIMRFDQNLRVLYLNPADLAATGKRLDEFIGKTNEEMDMPSELCNLWNEMFDKAKTTKQFQDAEFDFNTPAGKRTFNLRIVPEFDEDGSLVSYVGISRDITERKRAEEALKDAQAKLKEYAKDLERLVEERTKQLKNAERLAAIGATAGMVGHDIRNPLQAIIGDLYLAEEEINEIPNTEGKRAMQETLAEIQKNVDYINKVVADLQDFARVIVPAAQEVDLANLCEEVLFKYGVPENVNASCRVEPEASVLISDSALLKRILSNLTSNAVQAMPQGGELTIEAYKNAGDVVIVVEDTGVGIANEVKEKLFTPMFTTKAKGQGFGLAVVKRMAEALGGSVTYESEVGKGTKFIVRLPPPPKELNGKIVYKNNSNQVLDN